jgi:GTP-binding protein Era
MPENKENKNEQKCGFVAVLGAPNAGKSTLVNYIVGEKVSIVSPKVQTTRTQVKGIAIKNNTQVVFIDTPGIFNPKRRLDRAMVNSAWSGASDADLIMLLIDAKKGICQDTKNILKSLKSIKTEKILVLNKVDLIQKEKLLLLAQEITKDNDFLKVFMISAAKGVGVNDLFDYVCSKMPKGVWLYDEDQISDMPQRYLAAEITREKLFIQLRDELPYFLTVQTEKWLEQKDGSVKINQIIYVTKPSHKIIVLGEKGNKIKAIGQSSRKELEKLFDRRVHLFLFVKVRENCLDDKDEYDGWGLDFNA